jgi:hypothetical protein
VLGFLRVDRRLAPVEIGHERAIAGCGELVGHAADLIVHSPPFLNDDDPGTFGPRKIPVDALAVGTLEAH